MMIILFQLRAAKRPHPASPLLCRLRSLVLPATDEIVRDCCRSGWKFHRTGTSSLFFIDAVAEEEFPAVPLYDSQEVPK
jgi:hypothetical protein